MTSCETILKRLEGWRSRSRPALRFCPATRSASIWLQLLAFLADPLSTCVSASTGVAGRSGGDAPRGECDSISCRYSAGLTTSRRPLTLRKQVKLRASRKQLASKVEGEG